MEWEVCYISAQWLVCAGVTLAEVITYLAPSNQRLHVYSLDLYSLYDGYKCHVDH